jgi:ribosomal protein L33
MADSKFSKNIVKLRCVDCGKTNYYTRKNKKLVERKLEFKKYCNHKNCHKHTVHKEAKK